MSITIIGHLPSAGDARRFMDHTQTARNVGVGSRKSAQVTGASYRTPTFDYLTQVALAWERAGAEAVLVPTGITFEDSMVTSCGLMARTRNVKYLLAFRPALMTPVLMAQMVSTYQRYSDGRLLLNITPGLAGPLSHRFGDWYSKPERLEQAGEFIQVMLGSWGDEPFNFKGKYIHVEGASVMRPDVLPTLYYGGSSEESMVFAADYADVYLSFVEPPDMVEERLDRIRVLARERGRNLRFALSFQVITRDTADQAWAVADEMLGDVDQAAIDASLEAFRKSGAGSGVARRRLLGRSTESKDSAVISPNLWIGGMLVNAGRPPALVGSHEEIADRMEEYYRLGVTEFQVTGFPDVEESAHFGEGVMRILRSRGLLDDATPQMVRAS